MTAIRSRRGKWTHAASYGTPGGGRTVCGVHYSAWIVATSPDANDADDLIDCPKCIAALRVS